MTTTCKYCKQKVMSEKDKQAYFKKFREYAKLYKTKKLEGKK